MLIVLAMPKRLANSELTMRSRESRDHGGESQVPHGTCLPWRERACAGIRRKVKL
jgi:hypothetical protein